MLRDLFIASIEFKKSYPRLSEIGDRLLSGANEELKEEIYADSKPKSNQFFKKLLRRGISEGELDAEIDIDFTAFLLTDLTISIVDYFFEKNNPEELEIMIEYIDKMLYLIKNGIAEEGKHAISKIN